jgi:hypothetical protein
MGLWAFARLTLGGGRVYEGIVTLRGAFPDILTPDWRGSLTVRNGQDLPWPAPDLGSLGVLTILRSGYASVCAITSRDYRHRDGQQDMRLGLEFRA